MKVDRVTCSEWVLSRRNGRQGRYREGPVVPCQEGRVKRCRWHASRAAWPSPFGRPARAKDRTFAAHSCTTDTSTGRLIVRTHMTHAGTDCSHTSLSQYRLSLSSDHTSNADAARLSLGTAPLFSLCLIAPLHVQCAKCVSVLLHHHHLQLSAHTIIPRAHRRISRAERARRHSTIQSPPAACTRRHRRRRPRPSRCTSHTCSACAATP